ncbi:flippase [Halogeometricum luteum]|uniref:Flippase n=1 Tax=Halogeometricum luteum TaxID=2950537 RepID=A0ABU2FW84_9EURY|nr:flippase [Halogeometricum sp. S3BR5-2]MDS0292775.1 flippase [Halogeometricum sp. S3BR5-2]
MKLGQTSFVVFVSRFGGSVLGFFATLYIARTLGSAVFGTYTVVIALIFWLELLGSMGLSNATTKRISEGRDQSAYFTAGMISIAALGTVVISGLILVADMVNAYVGESVVGFVILLLVVRLFYSFVDATLSGERLVHIGGIAQAAKIGTRSAAQIGLVLAGGSLSSLLIGYAAGGASVGVASLRYISLHLRRPTVEHFARLVEYAKFSWLSQLETRSFNEVDVLVLNAFVSPSLVGVYAVAWNISKFLTIFGNSISATLFPEMSKLSAEEDIGAVTKLLEDGLAYSGLVLLPGLVGGVVLSERLLRIYGDEYVQGSTVLGLLILACLLYGYQNQLLAALNAIDRPDLAFRTNGLFIASNVALNVILVWRYGWVGAAAATVLATGIGLSMSVVLLSRVIDVSPPLREIGREVLSALVMGGALTVLGWMRLPETGTYGIAVTVGLVGVGAGVYFVTLVALSSQFRKTIVDNLPFDSFPPVR